ncbi:ATP-dependent Zn protease [Psychromonas marina]|uniref:ATP-dependent Zn protease n=1 Tax=Psychromonas marina TaxID=88364 RepID=A0ABQ6E567_9GAMM|nr:RimK/LysX family protein [Psychromonas marina]GLS92146.1 ATP-dependent Zn protease [Psychromonas marina]
MFLNKKTLFAAFTAVAITGCASTANTEQQEMITNLESSLSESTILTEKTQSELATSKATLAANEQKISALSSDLAKSQAALKAAIAASEKNSATEHRTDKTKVTHADDKTILGQAEWVYVSTAKENFKGRIDTGAATSSINAVDMERFERDGQKWVRFNLAHSEGEKADVIEAKIIRIAKIIQSSKPGVENERPVVKLHVRIGDVAHLTEFTLTNRLHMEYPVLIGRSFMRDVILVDVSKEYSFPKFQASAEK